MKFFIQTVTTQRFNEITFVSSSCTYYRIHSLKMGGKRREKKMAYEIGT
jgi:hypothetical protein